METGTTIPSGGTQPEEKEGMFSSFFKKIGRQLQDLSYVEVITAAGDPKTKIDPEAENVLDALNQVSIIARTRIELDGDIIVILPTDKGGEVKINKDVMDIHKANVDAAVQNWNQFMNTILQAIGLLCELTGLTKKDVFDQLQLSVTGPT
jgi:hypothetical protein